jgi:hypothetical protein
MTTLRRFVWIGILLFQFFPFFQSAHGQTGSIAGTVVGVASGWLAGSFGYAALFGISLALDFTGILFVDMFYRDAVVARSRETWSDDAIQAEAIG